MVLERAEIGADVEIGDDTLIGRDAVICARASIGRVGDRVALPPAAAVAEGTVVRHD